ncbi:hypothetical protein cauri_1769 [Corynebacterium aurimucosum ATCC 700975]|uniref:Uncharacterized protein n=2 Tax=Corynebacteriaceae TaxID=1653 RepID=C3PHQ8_CORA7|nr:hypothetical protein cauri_1769 [Corynebacterium aurimucosum ATCC 700975]
MVGDVGFRDAVGRVVYVDAEELDAELLEVLRDPARLAECNDARQSEQFLLVPLSLA